MISEQRLVELVQQADSMVYRAISTTEFSAPALVAEVFKVLVAQEPERAAEADRDEIRTRVDRIAEEFRNGAQYHEIAARQAAAAEGERSLFEHRAGRAL